MANKCYLNSKYEQCCCVCLYRTDRKVREGWVCDIPDEEDLIYRKHKKHSVGCEYFKDIRQCWI